VLALIQFLILVAIVWTMAYFRLSKLIWTPVIAVTLVVITALHNINWFVMGLAWLIFIPVAVLSNLPFLRRGLLTKVLLKSFRQKLPRMSQTEKDALEAGDVWWESQLFQGQPDWQRLMAMSQAQLTEEEQAFVDQQTETLCTMLDDWKIMHELKDLPVEVWDYIKKSHFNRQCLGGL